MIKLNGEWIGFYNYGEEYDKSLRLQNVPFKMIINEGINEFVGKIVEDETKGGFNDVIIVRGKLENDIINFVKFYKDAHYFDEKNNKISIESETSSKIFYSGKYFFEENKFKGEWQINDYFIDEQNILQDRILRGEWELYKKTK